LLILDPELLSDGRERRRRGPFFAAQVVKRVPPALKELLVLVALVH
jgi:hypothetical protein